MHFTSWLFAEFLLLLVPTYWALRAHRVPRTLLLLAASYAFYALWDWRFLGLLVGVTVANYAIGLRMQGLADRRRRALLLAAGVILNLGVLVAFKYLGFFVASAVQLFHALGLATLSEPHLSLILPLGISFYILQAVGYLVDVRRGQCEAERDPLTFGLFMGFFPQVISGPIARASLLLPQFRARPVFSSTRFAEGCSLIYWGLFKKLFVAENMAPIVAQIYAQASPSAAGVVIATVAFTFQLYCDFSGYTDIARGVARCLGIDLAVNFRQPYAAGNIALFWRRWHISLSTWFRDYVYIPLGGSRVRTALVLRNVMLAMLLSGLWHGAGLTFIVWGCYHGVLLCGHRLWRRIWPESPDRGPTRAWPIAVWTHAKAGFCVAGTFCAVALGWLFFRAEDMPRAARLLGALGGSWTVSQPEVAHLSGLAFFLVPYLAIEVARSVRKNENTLIDAIWPVRAVVYVVAFYLLVLYGAGGGTEFIYFRF
jgi:D-alanyl-lipoteichoic acid acyltransferase DltB (MBOAT superfamily)